MTTLFSDLDVSCWMLGVERLLLRLDVGRWELDVGRFLF
jgi:hypothetical protein